MTPEKDTFVAEAESYYKRELKTQLEASHIDEFVAIEPVSGDYFLGRTFDDAIDAACLAHPDRLCHVIQIGHSAAIHLGSL